MILIPDFTKKHFAYALIGVAALGATLGLKAYLPALPVETERPPAVTMEQYKSGAAAAVKDFAVNDLDVAGRTVGKLTALVVPEEGMGTHLKIVTAFAGYRDALAGGKTDETAAALSRVRSVVESEAYLAIVLPAN